MASSMKPVEVIQEVQILPRAMASHQPGSKTRWREETNVRNRVEQVSRVCIEPRKLFESRGPARDNHPRRPDPWVWEPRTVSRRWNAVSAPSLSARQGRGHRGRRPEHADTGRTRELVRASSASPERYSGTAISRHGVHHARPSPGCGDAGTGVWEPQPAQCPWGGPGHVADVQGHSGNQPGGMTRKTRQWHVLSATGCSPTDPQKQRQAATARASDGSCILHLLTKTFGNSRSGADLDERNRPAHAV